MNSNPVDLVGTALNEFDAPGNTVASLVRRAQRIAVLRHDLPMQVWCALQLHDVAADVLKQDPKMINLRHQLVALLGPEQGHQRYVLEVRRYFATRQALESENAHGESVEQVESTLAQIERAYTEMNIDPTNLTPIDAGLRAIDRDRAQGALIPQIGSLKAVLARVRQATYDYLIETEVELAAGQQQSSFLVQAESRINGLLNKYAPVAAEQFVAAQERISSGGPEDLAHSLTSCRRMIKSIADALYPPTGAKVAGLDGVERTMSDDAYRNRLLQYVRELIGKHQNGDVLQATLNDLGKRLNTLDALASKGVHAAPSMAEAQTCVVQTYFLAGDILGLAEGTSPLIATTNGLAVDVRPPAGPR
jgi:hypothetical protein